MRVVVLGAGGLVGSNVVTNAVARGWAVTGTYHTDEPALAASLFRQDIQETTQFETLIEQVSPDAVLNCAAMTDVDECEMDPEQAHAINASAPGDLARICNARGIAFVHLSTDYVFDGQANDSYDEDASPNPIQVYGESKLAGEQAVEEAHANPLLARLSFVYGVDRGTETLAGFPAWVRNRLEAREPTPIFTDQHVTPSRAGQVATALLDLLHDGVTGTFHIASRSCVTPYVFGDEIRERLGLPESLLDSGQQSDLDRPATRPENTCLDVGRLEAERRREQPTLAEDLDSLTAYIS